MQVDNGSTVRLYVPTAYNFANIDAIILSLKDKSAHLCPIQVTLSRDRKNSEKGFYTEMWQPWIESLDIAGLTINPTFVWIDKRQPATQHQNTVYKLTRQGEGLVQPGHQSIHIHIRQIDDQLAEALSL